MKITALFPKALKPRSNRWRILLWACVASIIFGAIELGQPLEDLARDVRSGARLHPVSGDITLVAIDNHSIDELGRYPWPRRYHAKLVDNLTRMGARQIVFDVLFSGRTEDAEDRILASSLERAGKKVVLPIAVSEDFHGKEMALHPLPIFTRSAAVAHMSFRNNLFGTVRRLPYDFHAPDGVYPSMAEKLTDVQNETGDFPVDFSLDVGTVGKVSAADVISGRAPAGRIAGKKVIIGTTYQPLNDAHLSPINGPIPGVYFHILGAETLKMGRPIEVPWFLTFLPALLIAVLAAFVRRKLFTILALSVASLAYLIVPYFLEEHFVYIQIMPPLFLVGLIAIAFSWAELRRLYRLRGMTNAISGLPNLAALSNRGAEQSPVLVAVRVHNYAAITSTLPPEAEKALVEQIAKRLLLGTTNSSLYQGDEGIFAWFAEANDVSSADAHLDALASLFKSPVVVEGRQFDLKITFGIDTQIEKSPGTRLAGALLAADEAVGEGSKWKKYDASRIDDTSWKLSLLSQLDTAIDAGDLWVAYQPKLDLKSRRIIGAEALARWTHPEKGPVAPMEFILAAEQNDRIEKLTYFVLDRAIRAAAAINQHGLDFNISINLSGRLIDNAQIAASIEAMLEKHRLPPSQLILEVTETAALSSNDRNLKTLHRLRQLGIHLSVDDYGTGMSTLDYLQRIPATEIKIDRSFILGMRDNQGTRVMVNSTIQLAHSLGQKVVAEGVEDQPTLDDLERMNCDIAQGYLIGRPMTFRALSKRMLEERGRRVA